MAELDLVSANDTPLSVADAISRLETGTAPPEMEVDIGDGKFVRLASPADAPALLQRLKGHRILAAVLRGEVSPARREREEAVYIHPNVKAMLDAALPVG